MNWLRDIAYGVGIAATSPFWGWRLLRTGKWRTDWKQRFGHPPEGPPATSKNLPANGEASDSQPTVLIHAVSVGEVNAIRQLVQQLTTDEANPCRVVICATTNTGIARARSLFEPDHQVVRFPFDFSRSVKRFLNAVQPDAVLLVELEVWPTFVNVCSQRNIPVAVINGRLSPRSFQRYKLIRPLIRSAFEKLAFAAVQTPMYASHFEQMGCLPDRIEIADSMKWDTAVIEEPADVPGVAALAESLGIDRGKPLVVAGSTGPGEEALLLKDKPNDVQLLIAPRKPERFEEVAALIRAHTGSEVVRRTHCPDGETTSIENAQVFLLDTLGELRKAYALADAVVIGRSWIDLYGSDPIEPIALGKPTVIGPRYGDFEDVVNEFRADEAIAIADAPWPAICEIIGDSNRAAALGEAGRQTIRSRQGSTKKHAMLIQQLLRDTRGG